MNPTPHTVVVPAADSLLEQADDLALLAFGAFSGASPAASLAGPRHLAFLTPDALDLDLDDPLQRHFANYELEQKIGQGGMGVVYRARQAGLDREVALKLLAAGPWASTDFIERFKREAQSAARMQHPNIVPIFEIGSQDGLHFFSMRLVRGPSLAQVLAEHGAMAAKPAAALVRTLAEALDYAHRLGVLHLDLKPGNVLIDEHGEPQVADFGLSRRLDQTVQTDSDEVSGTPSYMAPEQAMARANRFSQATDIYGLGTILYELITGRPPFLAATAQETLQRVVADAPESPRARDRRIPADLEAICLKCLAKEPAERYRTARELAEELARFVDGRAVHVRPLNGAQRIARWAKREPKFATAVLLVALSLVLGAGIATQQWLRAEAGTATVRELLWSQRLEGAMRALDQHNPAVALPLLATNLAEKEAAGEVAAASRDRSRIGAVLAAGPRLIALHHFDARIESVAVAPGGDAIAVGSYRLGDQEQMVAEVRMVDARTGNERWKRSLHGLSHNLMSQGQPPPDQMKFTPDGTRLQVHYGGPPIFPQPHGLDMAMLDVASGEPVLPPPSAFPEFSDANYSPDGKFALLRNAAGDWQAFGVEGWRALGPARKLGSLLMTLGSGGRFAAHAAAGTRTLNLYAVPELEMFWEVVLAAEVSAWNFDPAGTMLAAGLTNGQVILIDCVARSLRPLSPSPAAKIEAVHFVADGSAVIAISQDGSLMQWSLPSATLRHRTIRESGVFSGLAADSTGGMLAVIPKSDWALNQDSSIHLWRASAVADPDADPQWLGRITAGDLSHRQPVDLDGSSGLIAVGTRKGTLSVWRVPIAAQRLAPAPPLLATALEFDGRRLVATSGRQLWLTDAADGHVVWPAITLPQPIGFANLSATNDVLVATAGRTLYRIRAADGTSLGPPIELPNTPQRMSLARDGSIAVVSWLAYRDRHLNEMLAAFDLGSGRAAGEPVALPGPLLGMGMDRVSRRMITWRKTAVSVFELPSLRLLYPPIEFAGTPRLTPGKSGLTPPEATFWGRQLTDVIAGHDRLAVIRFMTLGPSSYRADVCSATLVDGAVFGCTAMPTGWISIAGDAQLQSVATSDGHVVRKDGSLKRHRTDVVPWPAVLALTEDGSRLARIAPGGVELLDPDSKERLAPLLPVELAPGDAVAQLAFSPDGRSLLGRTLLGRWLVWETPNETRAIAELQSGLKLLQRTEIVAPLSPAMVAMLARNDPGPPRQKPAAAVDAARWIDGVPVSRRSPDAPATALDLTAEYNLGFPAQHLFKYHAGYSRLLHPDGLQRLLGVDYDARGAISLAAYEGQAPYPASVRLALPRPDVKAINVLVGARAQRRDEEALPYLHVTLLYRDGSREKLTYDFHRDMAARWQDGPDPLGRKGPPWTAWLNYPSLHYEWFAYPTALMALRVPNPNPQRALQAVEFEAEATEWANPWILAVTIDPAVQDAGGTR